MKNIIIAIDGFSGCGKSSTARAVAKTLGYRYIDSGAMYRAVTLYFLGRSTDLQNMQEVGEALSGIDIDFSVNRSGDSEIFLNGTNVEQKIRSMDVNRNVSFVSTLSEVRNEMVSQQQEMGRDKSIVMDGRDIGTVVFPGAELKIFMTAGLTVRALRRQKELKEKGIDEELSVIQANLEERDRMDSSRATSPLRKASDAIEIDTSDLTFDEQVQIIVKLAEKKIHEH